MSEEEENWGDYVEDSEGDGDEQSEGQIELENIFYAAEGSSRSDEISRRPSLQKPSNNTSLCWTWKSLKAKKYGLLRRSMKLWVLRSEETISTTYLRS